MRLWRRWSAGVDRASAQRDGNRRYKRKVGDAVKILLDIDKVLTADELTDIASAAKRIEYSSEPGVTASVD